jgi:murein DD-endopeptidase MepM/ murein hydrolase activator NlpD
VSWVTGALLTLALGALEVRLQPGGARPGDAVLVEVMGATEAPSGQLGPTELTFMPFQHSWVALVGLSVDQKPTHLALEITGKTAQGPERVEGELEVRKPDFRRRQLSVGKQFTSPNKKQRLQSAADQKAFDEVFDRDFELWTFEQNFAWPRQAKVSAPFGDLRLFNGKKQSQHMGDDIDGEMGDPIYASNSGEIVMVRECFGSGGTVLIHHGGRLFTSYFHMSAFFVKVGEHVVQGQPLGKVGKSGRVTGPHLHFGAKLDGRWVDPESLLRLNFPTPPPKEPGPRVEDGGVSDRSTLPDASPGTP